MHNTTYDLTIVGGGAAGILAALSCRIKFPTYTISIIDRTFALGRKILVTGGGRCNITNRFLHSPYSKQFHGRAEPFLQSIFDQFGYKEITEYFQELGIELYEEKKAGTGKIYPLTNQAKTVAAVLTDELERKKIHIILNTEATSIEHTGKHFSVKTTHTDPENKKHTNSAIHAKHLILAAGSKTYPALGSNGSGYDLSKNMGHKIIHPVPSGLPLEGKNNISQKIQGIKVKAEVTAVIEGKEGMSVTDDIMFTKYGLSGTAILSISREISIHKNRNKKENCIVRVNFLPGKTRKEATSLFHTRWKKRPEQSVEKSLYGLIPNKVASVLVESTGINKNKPVNKITQTEEQNLSLALTGTDITITATRGWNEAEFTAGGVDTSEMKDGTLESKKQKRLYFCGEIIDVDGEIGGYNLSWCWSSGWIAGQLLK